MGEMKIILTIIGLAVAFFIIIIVAGWVWFNWIKLYEQAPDECPMHGEPMPCTMCEMYNLEK